MSRSMLPAVLLVLAVFLPLAAGAEDAPEPARPRIGLCLAGGGARGGAHVGVLKVLEELRIPVDYIAGTSIGSIVGGLYASGYSPAELDSVIVNVDWATVFKDTPPRQQQEYRRKEEDRLPYFGLEFGVNDGKLRLASGLISGQRLNFLLRQLTLHTTGIRDFDDLAIPYRAVAADLANGSMVVLEDCTLADALRASMSIPGAFTPVEINGRTLVDGGMVRNLPYDVVKSMGADVVIGIDVGTPVGELSDDQSFLGVIMRTLDLATKTNVAVSRAQFTDADLLMIPDLGRVTTASFPLMGEAAERGEEIARANLDRLRQFSVSEEEYAAWREHQRAGRRSRPVQVGTVGVQSSGRVDPRRIAPRIRTGAGEPLDLAVLQEDLTRVYRIGEFQSVDYRLDNVPGDSTSNLVISAHEKPWGPDYVRFGLALTDHFDGNATYNLLFYHRRAEVNALGGEWRNQLALGNRFVVDSEFYQPLDYGGRFFIAPDVNFKADKYKTFDSAGDGVNVDRDEWEARLDLGLTYSIWGEIRLGIYQGGSDGSAEDVAVPYRFSDDQGGWRARIGFDHLDNVDFPRHGWAVNADARMSRTGLGADLPYDRASVRALGATTAGKLTLLARVEGGTSFNSTLPVYDRYYLGGFTRLSGLEPGQLQGDQYSLATAGTYVRIGNIGQPVGGNVYLGLLGEMGQTWQEAEATALVGRRAGFSAFLGAETMLGPVYLGYGWTDGGDDSVYFYLGHVF